MATIHKRRLRSGQLVYELTHGTGADRQRIVVGQTREEAEEMLRQFNRQLGLHGSAPRAQTVAGAIDDYRRYVETNKRKRTVARYLRVLETFAGCFLAKWHPDVERLRDVRPMHLEEYKRRRAAGEIVQEKKPDEEVREAGLREELKGRRGRWQPGPTNARFGWLGRRPIRAHVSERTINYELLVLNTWLRWAVRQNLLFLNPLTGVDKFRVPKRALPKFMTSEDLKAFFIACSDAQRRLFMAILLTGMRKGEVEHLMWSDISFQLGVIFIQEKREIGWKPKTDERIIPISPTLQEILIQQWRHRASDQWVFPNEAGNIDTHILEKLKSICRRAGIRPATVHALRHSFGAHLRMAGVSLADIADLLGHKDLATTQIYARVLQEHLRAAVGKLTPLVQQLESGGPLTKALPPADGSETEHELKEESTPVAGRRKATRSRRPTQTS